MAYGQSNYPGVPQGIPPTRYSIKDIGCFITAFCNLKERFGRPIDPPTLNSILRNNNLYVDIDDGVRDDVAWDTITKVDGAISVSGTGVGLPPHDNCIVKFIYGGGKTHFCLVANAGAGLIIDSWDGVVKSWNVYGGPKAWASYNNNVPQGGQAMAGIPDQDNWYWRMRKSMQQIRGRDLGREEFRKNFVGVEPFHMIEILEDDPEADKAYNDQAVGQQAVRDNWGGQIAGLQTQLSDSNKMIATLQGKADLSDKLQGQVNDLTAKNQALLDQDTKDEEAGKGFFRAIAKLLGLNK